MSNLLILSKLLDERVVENCIGKVIEEQTLIRFGRYLDATDGNKSGSDQEITFRTPSRVLDSNPIVKQKPRLLILQNYKFYETAHMFDAPFLLILL